jgi:nicotinate-nucleotide adenylyltransferase
MSADAFLLLFGGSFNPPHTAHLRMAFEAAENLRPRKVLFIPCAQPPHKNGDDLLPFSFRCDLLRAGIADTSAGQLFEVSEVENERAGPSYTVDTLALLSRRYSPLRLIFIMGSEDYARLETWLRWQELLKHADLAVLPRYAGADEVFCLNSKKLWPEAEALEPPCPGVSKAYILPHGGRLLFLSQPMLEISSTLVRERYLAGRSLDFLVPPGVQKLLLGNATTVTQAWSVSPLDNVRLCMRTNYKKGCK